MLTVHHLNNSRSLRIVWLLEELGVPYTLVEHARDPVTRLSPPSLEAVTPLGKGPAIEDATEERGLVLVESGAIIDYIIRRHGGGRLAPDPASRDYDLYQMWLHYAEGSAMLPVMLDLYVTTRGVETPVMRARIDAEFARHMGFIEAAVTGRDFIVGDTLTGADIQVGFVAEMVDGHASRNAYPAIRAWLAKLKARPAYARAVAKAGANDFTRFKPRASA